MTENSSDANPTDDPNSGLDAGNSTVRGQRTHNGGLPGLRGFVFGALFICFALAWLSISRRSENALVVYCAHDLVFAEEILRKFEEETGIEVLIVGDSEATKSLGLVQRLLREKSHPKCDVFWNNQVLGTMDLADEGVLQPYTGTGYARIPDRFKDANGLWTGFAGRLRVWIVNTEKISANIEEINSKYLSDDLSHMAIAMPLYGTTLSHFSILWGSLGEKELKEWYKGLPERKCRIVPGNSTVKNLVSEGVCDIGWTDTDDFFVGLDSGAPVSMLPIRVNGQTICLPNSVAMIRGTNRQQEAARLIDYLLSEEVELALAQSESRQIPLGPVDEMKIPKQVLPLVKLSHEAINVAQFNNARKACLKWLQEEHLE